jgi:hypothetical protein
MGGERTVDGGRLASCHFAIAGTRTASPRPQPVLLPRFSVGSPIGEIDARDKIRFIIDGQFDVPAERKTPQRSLGRLAPDCTYLITFPCA